MKLKTILRTLESSKTNGAIENALRVLEGETEFVSLFEINVYASFEYVVDKESGRVLFLEPTYIHPQGQEIEIALKGESESIQVDLDSPNAFIEVKEQVLAYFKRNNLYEGEN